MANLLNARLKLYAEKVLGPEADRLRSVAERIEQFLGRRHYLRDSQLQRLLEEANQAIKVQSRVLWGFFASDGQKGAGESVSRFIESSKQMVGDANSRFVDQQLTRFEKFFDTIEKKPLTKAQRRASIINEDNNLVLAGAGTGKTSTMIGRAGYLLASGQARPDELLMLAFARKAKEEMQERQDKCLGQWLKEGTPTIKTFHAIGLEIIGEVEGRRPSLSKLAEDDSAFARFIDEKLTERLKDAGYKSRVVRFFVGYLYSYRNPFDFDSMQDYNDYVRRHELRTLRGEVVKSFEECEIANFLLQHGVKYLYEEPYIVKTAGPDFKQYLPDFFLPDYGIYIEHFALNKNGQPPPHFGKQRYLAGVAWKRKLHSSNGTKLNELPRSRAARYQR